MRLIEKSIASGVYDALNESTNYLKKYTNKIDKMSDKALYRAWLEVSKAPTEEKKYDRFGACVEVTDTMASDALWEIEGELCRRGYMDEDSNKTDKWKEFEENINESEEVGSQASEVYQYMLENTDYDVDRNGNVEYVYVPTYEEFNDTIMEISEEDFDKVRKEIEQAIYNTKFYIDTDGSGVYIELNDNHTVWNLNNENKQIEDWQAIVQAASIKFENETGVELLLLGRSGRHICVEVTAQNILNYDKLKEVQERLEQECVDEFNEKLEESFDPDKTAKRVARYKEFDNGHVLHSWLEDKTADEVEELARLASIENPDDVHYVQYDNVMNSSNGIRWLNGEKYIDGGFHYVDGKPVHHTDEEFELVRKGEKTWEDIANAKMNESEDVARDLGIEPGSTEEDMLNSLYDESMDEKPDVEYQVWQKYFDEDGLPARPELVIVLPSYENAVSYCNGLMKDPNCEAWVEEKRLNEAEEIKEDKKVTKVEVLVLPTIKFMWAEGNQDHIKALFGSAEEHDMDFSKFQNAVYVLDQEVSERDGGYDKVKYVANIQVKFTYEDGSTSEETTTYTGRVDCGDGYKYVTVSKNMKHFIQEAYRDAEVIVKEDDTAELKESATYEVDMTIEDNLEDEINNLLKSNNADGVQYKVVNTQGVGGGWPTVRFYGEDNKVKEFLGNIGFEDVDTYKVDESNINESEETNMTLKEYAMKVHEGYIDMDVTDTEIDMVVAFVCDFNETPADNYDKFLHLLGERTKVVKANEWSLVCDFTSVFKPYEEKLQEFFNMEYSEFDEAYYEAVVSLEGLIPGMSGEKTYGELIDILNN